MILTSFTNWILLQMLHSLVTSTIWIWLKWNNTLISTSISTGLICRNKLKRKHFNTFNLRFQLLEDLYWKQKGVIMIMKMNLITTKLTPQRENLDFCNNSMLITITFLIQVEVISKQKPLLLNKLKKLLKLKQTLIRPNLQTVMMSSILF